MYIYIYVYYLHVIYKSIYIYVHHTSQIHPFRELRNTAASSHYRWTGSAQIWSPHAAATYPSPAPV